MTITKTELAEIIDRVETGTTTVADADALHRVFDALEKKNFCNDVLHKCAVCTQDADGPFYCYEHK